MKTFQFFKENLDITPKTRDEVKKIVTEQFILLYENMPNMDEKIENWVNTICEHLNIPDL